MVTDQNTMGTNNESLLKCEICLENLSDSSFDFKNNHQCVHSFCEVCIKRYINVKVNEQGTCNVACPGPKCHVTLDPLTCREYLPSDIFTKWCDNLCRQAILGFGSAYCPNQKCSAMVISECAGDVRKATCPNCKNMFCFKCEVPWHTNGYTCEESRKKTKNQNDKKFKMMAKERNWRSCPRCKRCIERIDGCDLIICRCGTRFCYNCGETHAGLAFRCMSIWCCILDCFYSCCGCGSSATEKCTFHR